MSARARQLAWLAPLLIACVVGMAFAQAPAAPPQAPRDSARAQAPYKMPPLGKALASDMHNKLIHFPIVLTMVAAVVLVAARRKRELEPVAFWLVWAAALSVIPAYFTGKAQAEHFHGRPKEWLVAIHEKQAITIGILEAFWVLSLLKTGTRRWAWLLGVVLVVLVASAGFIGGLVAHGH